MKTHKTKKAKGQRGQTTHGHGARKKWKGSGHRGGIGMAGTGKRADQKKTLINARYGNKYFGKKGITSLHSSKDKSNVINLHDIQKNIKSLMKNSGSNGKLDLKKYKILGEGEIKDKLVIVARGFTKSAKEKIEKVGGEAILFKPLREKIKKVEVKKETKDKKEQ